MTDIEIANSVKTKKILTVAKKIGLTAKDLELHGDYMAKIKQVNPKKNGKLVLVTAINPTSAGEGKTTVSIGLADAFGKLKKNVCLALREPSLGPVFGLKGGAAGGGHSQVLPMDKINLHFTGDFHAITSANNLLCSFIDNHLLHGNELNIDPERVVFRRCMDLNDRALRDVEVTPSKDLKRKDKFNITAASEIMAILALASDIEDLKYRLGEILVAYDTAGNPVFAKQLNVADAMTILLMDAIKPNLVQTLEGTPAIVHCGPFANIAHGCNSIIATRTAKACADYVVTEAGFGSDLGAEKFFDVKCRIANLKPDAVVLVATIRALKLHGGNTGDLQKEDLKTLEKGLENLYGHINSIKNVFKLPVVVAINQFTTDTKKEINLVKSSVEKLGVKAAFCTCWAKGGKGAIDLANEVLNLFEEENNFTFCYDEKEDVKTKITKIATKVYGAKDVVFTETAEEDLKNIVGLKRDKLPVVIAKTQYSFSDKPELLGAPKGFTMTINNLELRNGAGFVLAIANKMMLMPGLGKTPAGAKMKIENNVISGLF